MTFFSWLFTPPTKPAYPSFEHRIRVAREEGQARYNKDLEKLEKETYKEIEKFYKEWEGERLKARPNPISLPVLEALMFKARLVFFSYGSQGILDCMEEWEAKLKVGPSKPEDPAHHPV